MSIVGIDLGTTHCAMAWIDPNDGPGAKVVDFPIPQLVRPGEVVARALLPSCIYLASEHELPEQSFCLPWPNSTRAIVGELARWRGAQVPSRLVSSAKSWLCHSGVDRSEAILPWAAAEDVPKVSPVEASARLLSHLASAWDHAHPDAPLAESEVVVTVPASFDEVARSLTVSAARKAGLEKFTLLEEPQAAFYDFSAHHREDLAEALREVRLVLVVDVGGGTTDFTLIQVAPSPQGPALRRIAVGDHLMLGGDNMDAALAHRIEQRLALGGKRLGIREWNPLLQSSRVAKESLLSADPPEQYHFSIATEGSGLLKGSRSIELTRTEAEQVVLDGFFPMVGSEEAPQRRDRMALQEVGLPYVQDPAVTRHLAAFLRQHAAAAHAALGVTNSQALPRPDAILLNGGVFNSPKIARRLVEAASSWWPLAPRIGVLEHRSLDLAVARGAAYYGLVRHGLGRRISGGAARAFYVGLADSGEAAARQALCLIPRGFEEGESVDLGQRRFKLTVGRPVQFPLYSTSADRTDRPGDIVAVNEELRLLPPLHTLLRSAQSQAKAREIPVHLKATLTEIGTLELWSISDEADERWRLEFELRGFSACEGLTVTEPMPARFSAAREELERIFGHKPLPVAPRDVKQLTRALEKLLGPREGWRLPVLRELWGALYAGASKRRRSADHERVFFQLLGYTLRPGFGYPLDGWRCDQSFALFAPGVQFLREKPNWIEFWVMWRRAAGGLNESAHAELWRYLKPHLERKIPPQAPKATGKAKGIEPEGLDEMVRTAASLEHLAPEEKAQLGDWVAERLSDPSQSGGPWAWALGRIGTRVPLYGSSHRVVPAAKAEQWLQLLLQRGLEQFDGGPFAAAQLARLSGDRARDVDPAVVARVAEALAAAKAPASWIQMVNEVVVLREADEARALGDTLPAGLQLS